jgi:alkylated DNA nucleotide flippase Atl1
METNVRTPQDVFMQPQHLVVPPFQRPYVWEKEEQWAPLWQDVRRLADLRVAQGSADARHFLGAIVVQAQEPILGDLLASSIIDGQQRLTTLQLLMDATAAALEAIGEDALAARLDRLTHNEDIYVLGPNTRLKLRHSNKDRAAFDEVMDADGPVDHDTLRHAASRVVRAHEYFTGAVTEWLDPATDGAAERAQALTSVLTHGLQLVAINLTVNENSQEIFETLNARGTPLTAADLIRNFVFQRLAAEGADTRVHLLRNWLFETDFWEKDVSAGRYTMQRSSLFFNQWLVSRLGEEISPRATFTRFKQYVEQIDLHNGQKVADLLPVIREQAKAYEAWTMAAEDDDRQLNRVELAVYRMRASDSELLKPLLIWLHEPGRDVPADVIARVTAAAESWLVRRQLLRLAVADMGRIVADMMRTYERTPPGELADSIERHLSRLNVTSTYWPGNQEIRETLRTERVFRRFKKARLRMLLEAIEDDYRRGTNQPQVPRRGYPVEHILPQTWAENWPVPDPEAEEFRAEHVHRLGNLTLLTRSLNSKVSNGPWAIKRAALQANDTLLLNSRLLATVDAVWDEAAIDSRTDAMIDVLLAIWPVPEGHSGVVVDPHEKSAGWIQVKHLVEAGLLIPGTTLTSRPGTWGTGTTAVVRPDGLLEVDGKTFDTPSGAGRYVKDAATNGWGFWSLPDGRKLKDVRAAYTGEKPEKAAAGFDWSALHAILEALPEGHWTTYGSLADAVGTAAQPLGAHIASCEQCSNAHRILRSDATVAPDFRWSDPEDGRDPLEMLRAEGALTNGDPDPARELRSDDLQVLIEQ